MTVADSRFHRWCLNSGACKVKLCLESRTRTYARRVFQVPLVYTNLSTFVAQQARVTESFALKANKRNANNLNPKPKTLNPKPLNPKP